MNEPPRDGESHARVHTDAGVPLASRIRRELPGIAGCILVAGVSAGVHEVVPALSPAALAILIGLLMGILARDRVDPGVRRCAGRGLEFAIVLTGLAVPLTLLPGPKALAGLVTAMLTTLGVATLLGRVYRVGRTGGVLAGMGTAVCGSAAIGAIGGVIRAPAAQVGAAIASVNLISASGMLLMPWIGGLLGTGPEEFGWWTGGSLPAFGQAVGAAYAHSVGAGEVATLVKLFRIGMLVVLVPAIGLAAGRRAGGAMPWFLPGFVAAALLASAVPIPAAMISTGRWVLWVALAGIGASIRPGDLREQGPRILFLCITAFSVQLAGILLLGILGIR